MESTVVILIKGKVQGVFFRRYIKDLADSLKLRGYVVNLPDGNIEALFQGMEDDVMKAVNLCKKGPDSAKVEMMKVRKLKDARKYGNFEIHR